MRLVRRFRWRCKRWSGGRRRWRQQAEIRGNPTKLIIALVKPFMLNSKQGATVSLYLAASPEVAQVSGEYFVKSKPAKSNPLSRDPKVMAEVWLCTAKMTGLPLA